MAKNNVTYEFLDLELLNSFIKNNDYSSLINYLFKLETLSNKIEPDRQEQFYKELKICKKLITKYILSLKDEKLANKIIFVLFDNNIDIASDNYEKFCAKLINNKTPEEAMDIYKEVTKHFFYIPSETILKFISSSTKKSDTCLFFIKDLEQNYQKNGNYEYDKYILDFYKRFRAVCSKEEFEQFVESGTQEDNNLQKQ